jgi:small subunit ribosomal protein S2
MVVQKDTAKNALVENMFKVGAHYGYKKSRRHPSVSPFIFGVKNNIEIFNLEETSNLLSAAKAFMKSLGREAKQVLFVGGKYEAQSAIKEGAISVSLPYVAGRWIGGTLTNLTEIKKRVNRLEELRAQREKGELAKYTKKERLLLDREIEHLEDYFGGIVSMVNLPSALFIIDSRKEDTAVREAHRQNIPIIALCGSDCNIQEIDYPIVGNDASRSSIAFFVNEIVSAYREGAEERQVAGREEAEKPNGKT